MKINKKYKIVCCLLWLSLTAMAQDAATDMDNRHVPASPHWYVGVQGGVPFGISTFSSFGADKTRAGYDFGLYGGYSFNPVLSAEISMKWGKTALSAQDCCIEKGYWLGADGVRYHAPVAGLDGWSYADLESSVTLRQYAIQLNVNVFGLFERTRKSPWRLEVSPLLAAVGTKAAIKTTADDAKVMQGSTNRHLGLGGNLQAGYRLTEHLNIGIYSGITYLTGKRMDGMPEYVHKRNYIWESGIRLGWSFGKCGKVKKQTQLPAATTEQPRMVCPEQPEHPEHSEHPEKPERPTIVKPNDAAVLPVDTASKAETAIIAVETEEEAILTFPTVYFAFNRTNITASEEAKLHTICRILKEHPDVYIIVTGWCDNKGNRAVNDRMSHQRARAVKSWLVRHGITAERIRTQGKGTDRNEPDAAKARRAVTEEQRKEEQR